MSRSLSIITGSRPIKRTTSRCPVCHAAIAAEVVERGAVYLEKSCPEHGRFDVLLASDPRFYHVSTGHAAAGGCCGPGGCGPGSPPPASSHVRQHAVDPFDVLSTCIALIEIVDSCNLSCPTCYASSPPVQDQVEHLALEPFIQRVEGVLDLKGHIDILQLSGGEPTLHPQFMELLEWCLRQSRVGYVLINTNAVRIAGDTGFREQLGALRRQHGRFELYVQFDGVQAEGQRELRGADLRTMRQNAIDMAGALGVPSTMAMTVTPQNLAHTAGALRFGLQRPHCRGISYQPVFESGRRPTPDRASQEPVSSSAPAPASPAARPPVPLSIAAPQHISVGDIVHALARGAGELISAEDFTPLPCGDPNCHTISYLLRLPSGPVPLGRLLDLEALQGFLHNRVDYRLEDLARCGCESEPLGQALKHFEIGPHLPFRIFIKPFMDAWTYDQDRIDRCCTHVIRPDGRLDSFCRYYLEGGAAGIAAGR